MKSLQDFSKQILIHFIEEQKLKERIAEYVRANYNFIPVNSRYKVRRSEIFSEIAEGLKLTLAAKSGYRVIAEVLHDLGVRRVESHGRRSFKGLISKKIELTEEHTKIIRSCIR